MDKELDEWLKKNDLEEEFGDIISFMQEKQDEIDEKIEQWLEEQGH